MAGPILWGPTGATSLQSALVLPGSTSGNFTIIPAATTASYTLTLPSGQASGASALVNDGSGNGSWLNYTSTVTNSVLVSRDSNGNSGFNNSSVSVQTVVSAGQTITMTAGSTGRQRITGTSSVTFNLPDCTTLLNGWPFYFNNTSSSSCTVNRQDGVTLVATLPANSITYIACMDNSTVQGVWAATPWLTPTATSGSAGTTLPGSLGLNGTSSGTFTFNPAATTTTYSVTLPSAQGTGALTNNGSGALSWAAAGGLSLSAVGASPNANAATLTGSALNLQPFDGTHPGVVTASGGGSTNFLRADGSWAAPAGTGPLTTKGDIFTFSTVNARQPVPGDYGDLIADSTTATGWRAASYVQTNGRPDKNYIQYADFENNSTTGWTLGTIGTLTNGLPTGSPTFGSGASGNLSLAIASSSQLSGAFSLSYVSSAATTAGNMVASSSYAIDPSSQAKVLQISFAYNIFSGAANANFSGTSSNSYAWAIWDVTNSSWLTSAGNFNLVQNSGVGICTGTCQTNATTANIRLVVYNANATSGAATMYFDDFFVGPQIVQKGPAMSDWVSGPNFVPASGAFGTISGSTWYTQRVGDSLAVRGYWVLGTTAGGTASIALPSGYSIDTTKLGATANSTGVGKLWSNTNSATPNPYGTGNVAGAVFYDGSTSGSVFLALSGKSSGFNKNVGTDFGGSFQMAVEFTIPIAGWSSSSVQSSDTDTRVVAASVKGTPASVTSGNPVIFPTIVQDTHGAYNATTGEYTAPVTGFYSVNTYVNSGSFSANQLLGIYIGGSLYGQIGPSYSANNGAGGSLVVYATAGQTIDVRPSANMASMNASVFSINRLSGPAVISAASVVAAAYFTSTTGTATTSVPINFDTKQYDTHAAVTTGASWKFSAPISGFYRVSTFQSATSGSTGTVFSVYKNGSNFLTTNFVGNPSTTDGNGFASLQLNAGDTIELRPSVSFAWNGNASPTSNNICTIQIERIGGVM